MRTILAIGAYDRDNFGDYLFLDILRHLLPNDKIVPGSYLYATIPAYGLTTLPYDYVLSHYPIDAVWVVGGELGGVRVNDALAMSLSYQHMTTEALAVIKRRLGVPTQTYHLAYLPDLSRYPKNKDVPYIINSIGLSHAPVTGHERRFLQQATFLGVRDQASTHKLSMARLAPDAVHALQRFYPSPKNQNSTHYLIFQANQHYIHSRTFSMIASQLAVIASRHRLSIKLVAAGIAPGHDSMRQLKHLQTRLSNMGVSASVVTKRTPLLLVHTIAQADLVIGTSLHLRIAAESYHIPRISLESSKVSQYAQLWDANYPHTVLLKDLPDAVDTALVTPHDSATHQEPQELALAQLLIAKNALPPNSRRAIPLDITAATNNFLKSSFSATIDDSVNIYYKNQQIRKELSSVKEKLSQVTEERDAIKNSGAWRAYRNAKKLIKW